jgi:hypothetical protein
MARLTKKNAESLLRKPDRYLYVTFSSDEQVYAVNGAGTVPRKIAEGMTLFGGAGVDLPMQRRGELALLPQEDGLFPGFSQTWRAA